MVEAFAHILWPMYPAGNAGVHTNTLRSYQIVWEGKIGCSKLTPTCHTNTQTQTYTIHKYTHTNSKIQTLCCPIRLCGRGKLDAVN